ncbi:MAG: formimidoylglutamate deiminase [Rhizobiaceae bacterium]|nr:formimidoylglutamate deiminase [Rhizobiaceae bacterium]
MNFVGTLFAKHALLATGWAKDIRIKIGANGTIDAIEINATPQAHDVNLTNRALLPAPSNLHSHAFQRAMAGLTEYRSAARDNFWTWRKLMFKFADILSPDDAETIAAFVQMEMLEAGYAASGEFHYLHHQAEGVPYDDPAEMANRMVAAAETSGIGLTLLPVLYRRGGLDDSPLSSGQSRFGCTHDLYEKLISSAQNSITMLGADSTIGVAPHSLRAVSKDDLKWVQTLLPDAPVHIHVAEQTIEVDDVIEAYGARPVQWLMDNNAVDSRWCLIHATHMNESEVSQLANSGAVVGLCPITESNLGDGIFEATKYLSSGGLIGFGSDSNIRISLSEELRTLEYSQRLRDRTRAVLVDGDMSVGRNLFEAVSKGSAQAMNRNSGQIAVGQLADLLTLDTDSIHTTGLEEDKLLDGWIFAGDDNLVRDVFSAGRHLVVDGQHKNHSSISGKFHATINKLRQSL